MKSTSIVVATAVGLGIGTITISWFLYRQRKKRSLQHPHGQWQQIGTLKEINLFPVKSAAAVQLQQADCDEYGLSWQGFRDRRLVLFNDTDGKMCFANAYPLMMSIQSELVEEAVIRLTAPDAIPLRLDLSVLIAEGVFTERRMWGYRCPLVECKAEHHAWFSQVTLQRDTGMRLFIALDPIIETSWWGGTKHDLVAIMAMHEKSVDDLNSRLSVSDQAHHRQFRGNFLIESSAAERVRAFDEDNWLWCRIGDDSNATVMHVRAPCLRCIMVNVDIFTCLRNVSFEPLKTLKKYRMRSHPVEPEMGLYMDIYKAGVVKKGDPVYVQYKSS